MVPAVTSVFPLRSIHVPDTAKHPEAMSTPVAKVLVAEPVWLMASVLIPPVNVDVPIPLTVIV